MFDEINRTTDPLISHLRDALICPHIPTRSAQPQHLTQNLKSPDLELSQTLRPVKVLNTFVNDRLPVIFDVNSVG
jgi:hypothetical protein